MTVEEMKEIIRDYNLKVDRLTLMSKALELLNCELLRHDVTQSGNIAYVFKIFKRITEDIKSELEISEDLILGTCTDLIGCYKSDAYKDKKDYIRLVVIY